MSHHCTARHKQGLGTGLALELGLAGPRVVAAESFGPPGSHRAASGGEEGTVCLWGQHLSSLREVTATSVGGRRFSFSLATVPFLSGCKQLGTASPQGHRKQSWELTAPYPMSEHLPNLETFHLPLLPPEQLPAVAAALPAAPHPPCSPVPCEL